MFTHILIKIRICSPILFAEQFSGPSVCNTVLYVSELTGNLKCLAQLRIVTLKPVMLHYLMMLYKLSVYLTTINVIRLVRTPLFESHINICLELVTPDVLGACDVQVPVGCTGCRAISGFNREADVNCAPLGYYAASGTNSLPTFQDNLSVPSARIEITCRRFGTTYRSHLRESKIPCRRFGTTYRYHLRG